MPRDTPGQGPSRTVYFSQADAEFLNHLIEALDDELEAQGGYRETSFSAILRAIIAAYRRAPVPLLPIIRATQGNVDRFPWKYVPNPNPKGGRRPARIDGVAPIDCGSTLRNSAHHLHDDSEPAPS